MISGYLNWLIVCGFKDIPRKMFPVRVICLFALKTSKADKLVEMLMTLKQSEAAFFSDGVCVSWTAKSLKVLMWHSCWEKSGVFRRHVNPVETHLRGGRGCKQIQAKKYTGHHVKSSFYELFVNHSNKSS